MKPADREKEIQAAFERGDTEILGAIYGHNRVTWGGTSKPLDAQFEAYIESAAPEAKQAREALDRVTMSLELAVDTFMTDARKWRQPEAAARGFAQEKDFEKADAAMKAALGMEG